jgi:hypothetical protein
MISKLIDASTGRASGPVSGANGIENGANGIGDGGRQNGAGGSGIVIVRWPYVEP